MKLVTVTRNCAKYIAAALMAAACTVQELTQEQAPTPSEPAPSSGIITGEATIEFSDDMTALVEGCVQGESVVTKSADLNSVLTNLGAVSLERVFPDAGPFEGRTRRAGLHRFYKVVFSNQTPLTKAVTDLSELSGVISVTPHHQIEKRASFNDPLFSKQWHYVSSSGKVDINVKEVWEKYTTGSNKVIVDVVDEPIDASHPDLQANLWTDELGHTGFNFARGNWDLTIRPNPGKKDGEWYGGDTGHGTHVAGTVAAVNNNGTGLCGVAGGDYANGVSGVRLQSSAIFSGYDTIANDAETANAVKWGADHGAVISQNSWGFVYDENIDIETWKKYNIGNYDPALKAAVDYFIKYAGCDDNGNQLPDSPMKGGLVIFAAGNDNVPWDIISSYEPIIAVGAFNEKGNKASYSNYGSWVDIAAPSGEGYRDDGSDATWSTLPQYVCDNGKVVDSGLYGGAYWAGTSMACPHVSGVAALIVSYFGGPGFTADAAKEILSAGLGETIGGNKPIGKKMNALASFEYGVLHYPAGGNPSETPEPPVLKLKQNSVSVHAHEEVEVSYTASDPNGDAITITLEKAGSRAISLNEAKNCLVIDGWKDEPGTYTATLRASDKSLFTDVQLEYTLLPNHAPQVWGKVDNLLLSGLQKVGSVQLAGLFHDEDGEELAINVVSSDAGCAKASVDGSRVLVTPVAYGNAVITITATDFMGEDVSVSLEVAVLNPDQPARVTPEVASTEAVIYVETEKDVEVSIKVYSSTGTLVLESQTQASAFHPVHLDVSTLAPGRYTAVLEYNDVTRKLRIIKY
ncbi:MAG: S8 family serine peptidase [Bacteroidales bacterium]|nr:S8 family serine peptidase [Bacteroidales bacterium]